MNNAKKILAVCCLSAALPVCLHTRDYTNSIGMKMVDIAPGSFLMGGPGYGRNYDEAPAHEVVISAPFRISATEVTNAQYELFDPGHREYRGRNRFSFRDGEAVVYVSWDDAAAFCEWLSEKEGKSYRLPTEAEWEYVCRAGSMGPYAIGDRALPKSMLKNQVETWDPRPVPLDVGKSIPNAWGVYDMHGNVEEWCLDWYGPYPSSVQKDPAGPAEGISKVVRGGSHNTPAEYLRSSNRSSSFPGDRTLFTGFRIVEVTGDSLSVRLSSGTGAPDVETVGKQDGKRDSGKRRKSGNRIPDGPFFSGPVPFVRYDRSKEYMFTHNHCPAVTWLGDGSLLAIWFSAENEKDREMTVLSSRYDPAKGEWSSPELFFKAADRNMTGSSLYYDGESGLLYHFNGVEAAGTWGHLALVMRTSADDGRTWSAPVFVNPEHEPGNQVIAGTIRTAEGYIVQPCDATHTVRGGSILHISMDGGKTWERSDAGHETEVPVFTENGTGHRIAGIHAGVVQLSDGSLLAFGRDDNIVKDGKPRMPASISHDMGKTWTYHATEFPPVSSGQRLVLKRLNEGPLMMISFTDASIDYRNIEGMAFSGRDGEYRGYGMYAALSFDEGKTWPVKKLLTDGTRRYLDGGAFTGWFLSDVTHAEPKGYLAVTQGPDNMIHLCTSALHYMFNLEWLMEK